MDNEQNISSVSNNLLSFLREMNGDSKIDYQIPPSQLQGGFDTSIYRFKLKNISPPLSEPLVLRVFSKSHSPIQAIKESVVHNSLIDQGFLVPYVYYTCIDQQNSNEANHEKNNPPSGY